MEKQEIKKLLDKLYEQTKHGDPEHQKWLKDKFDDFYNVEVEGIVKTDAGKYDYFERMDDTSLVDDIVFDDMPTRKKNRKWHHGLDWSDLSDFEKIFKLRGEHPELKEWKQWYDNDKAERFRLLNKGRNSYHLFDRTEKKLIGAYPVLIDPFPQTFWYRLSILNIKEVFANSGKQITDMAADSYVPVTVEMDGDKVKKIDNFYINIISIEGAIEGVNEGVNDELVNNPITISESETNKDDSVNDAVNDAVKTEEGTLKKFMITRYDETITEAPFLTIKIGEMTVNQPKEDNLGEVFFKRIKDGCLALGYTFNFYSLSTDKDYDYEVVVE